MKVYVVHRMGQFENDNASSAIEAVYADKEQAQLLLKALIEEENRDWLETRDPEDIECNFTPDFAYLYDMNNQYDYSEYTITERSVLE